MHRFEEMLVSEVGLEKIHAKVFLHITGKSTVAKVASDGIKMMHLPSFIL